MPWTMGAFVLLGLSLIGMPLTAGFISKWYLVQAALDLGTLGVVLVAAILISSLMAVVYIWRVVEVAYFQSPQAGASKHQEAPLMMLVPLWAVVLANVYFGLDPSIPVDLATNAANILLEHAK
ncbi:hypothetical protein JCM17845_09320 [Iodidimonas gelatinilytica]|uniref:NADH:quinone oxidoreductase/Mrp antiporter transmembrane domain-containing protein n=1 Tax=Iodidimonas gelatinilytica TaxID=1236966 RepID=A0A5A7MZB0_9PROT|nr:proton-conducting transporter membrane subunit [Iodidimonas gelatinilytica]GER00309.1 hypothetical protein JCM17845_09320 [Iodidimonas gelatinilytica]